MRVWFWRHKDSGWRTISLPLTNVKLAVRGPAQLETSSMESREALLVHTDGTFSQGRRPRRKQDIRIPPSMTESVSKLRTCVANNAMRRTRRTCGRKGRDPSDSDWIAEKLRRASVGGCQQNEIRLGSGVLAGAPVSVLGELMHEKV